jgi:hypothetical protein
VQEHGDGLVNRLLVSEPLGVIGVEIVEVDLADEL